MFGKARYVWFSLGGSIDRKTYLTFYYGGILGLFVLFIAVTRIFGTPGNDENLDMVVYKISVENGLGPIAIFLLVAVPVWGFIASSVKRLHDMGASGWWMLVVGVLIADAFITFPAIVERLFVVLPYGFLALLLALIFVPGVAGPKPRLYRTRRLLAFIRHPRAERHGDDAPNREGQS